MYILYITYLILVDGFNHSKKYEFASWDYEIPNCSWKVIKCHVPVTTNQISYIMYRSNIKSHERSRWKNHHFSWWNPDGCHGSTYHFRVHQDDSASPALRCGAEIYIYWYSIDIYRSLDWLKGKPTGNHGFPLEI